MLGDRYNFGKPRVELLSSRALIGIASVLEFGARKYEEHNWRKGLSWSDTLGSTLRHLLRFMSGEDVDKESGLPHIDHVMTNAMFLSEMQKLGRGVDDRWKESDNTGRTNGESSSK